MEATLAMQIDTLSQRYGHARARRLGALSGYAIDGSTLAEIYHSQFALAAGATRLAPDFACLEWKHALAAAQKEADAAHYGERRDSVRLVSRDQEKESTAAGDDSAAVREWSTRTCRRGSLRRMVKHARECLVAHWSLSSSRTWRAALTDDLARLATLARVARGASFGELGNYVTFKNSAARKSLNRISDRMASGDLLLTEKPDLAQAAVDAWKSRRAWVPACDYMIASA